MFELLNIQTDFCIVSSETEAECAKHSAMKIRGLHGPDFSGPVGPAWLQSRSIPARSKNKNFGLDPARTNSFCDFGPDRLGLSTFKTDSFS